jgi:hypothetical protein
MSERCISCGGLLLDGDEVHNDVDGGVIHSRCCDPNGFVDNDGNPTAAPAPYVYGSVSSNDGVKK